MSEHTVWFVDEAVAEDDVEVAVSTVVAHLMEVGLILPALRPGIDVHEPSIYPPGPKALSYSKDESFGQLRASGLLICAERTVFHAGGNGVDALQCPHCGAEVPVDSLPWSKAVGAWYERSEDDLLACPSCETSTAIPGWQFCVEDTKGGYVPWNWAFGNLGFGFQNWAVEERVGQEIAAILKRPVKLVYQSI